MQFWWAKLLDIVFVNTGDWSIAKVSAKIELAHTANVYFNMHIESNETGWCFAIPFTRFDTRTSFVDGLFGFISSLGLTLLPVTSFDFVPSNLFHIQNYMCIIYNRPTPNDNTANTRHTKIVFVRIHMQSEIPVYECGRKATDPNYTIPSEVWLESSMVSKPIISNDNR